MGAPYIYDISRLRVKDLHSATYIYVVRRLRVNTTNKNAVYFFIFATTRLGQFLCPTASSCTVYVNSATTLRKVYIYLMIVIKNGPKLVVVNIKNIRNSCVLC